MSLPGPLRETPAAVNPPDHNGPRVWVLEAPCRPWSDRDGEGRPLQWSALHPKARDFLSTEATFQKLGNDRGYVDYARALIAGEPLDQWHRVPLFATKLAEAKRPGLGRWRAT